MSNHNTGSSHTTNTHEPERTLFTIKPLQRITLPKWIAHIALGIIVSALFIKFPSVTNTMEAMAQNIFGNGFWGLSWMSWGLLAAWAALLSRPAWSSAKVAGLSYEVTDTLLYYNRGVFDRDYDQIELARIRDLSTKRSLLDRILGVGSIIIESADRSHPYLKIPGLKSPFEMERKLHEMNISERARMGYREIEGTQNIG